MKKQNSRHPKIQYWAIEEDDILSSNYKEVIDRIKSNGCFDTLCISTWTMNLWDISTKPLIEKVVRYANDCGIKTPLQVFPKGNHMRWHAGVGIEDAEALVTEYERIVVDSCTVIRAVSKNVRNLENTNSIDCELLRAYAFKKCGDGFYEAESLIDITDRAKVIYKDGESLTLSFDTEDLYGYCIYAMVAHYYEYIDLFSDLIIREYKDLIDAYSDLPLSGIVLDEFKHKTILPPWLIIGEFRERFYGKNFHRCFEEQTGRNLITTMFDMRFCPKNKDEIRISAINLYFDVFRRATKAIETFVAEYSQKVFGACSFPGLHNTFHNSLQNDEIWATGCSWWDVPRKYAQTDEDICYPIRMGIACGCPENLIYDMYYSTERNNYLRKAVRDARFGCRIHYHIIRSRGNSNISLDTGNPEFLAAVKPYEDKIELLNLFDTVMPKMELLVVFGFPALCNWYPDYAARNTYDLNGKLNIERRVQELWEEGYLNALAPSDALCNGRITMKDGYFYYCGHKFSKMLYLYPEYSKREVLDFLKEAKAEKYNLKVIGDLTRDFNGNTVVLEGYSDMMLKEDSDIPKQMQLTPNSIPDGCILEDGSVVITNYDSITNDEFCTYSFNVGRFNCAATFKGVFAVKMREDGNVQKIAAGNLKEFIVDGKCVLKPNGVDTFIN